MRTELLIGCGSNRVKKLRESGTDWNGLVTLDMNQAHQPDVVHDLAELPLPFADDSLDEIHAYDVLEHIGQQGDWHFFFAQWMDFWRMLRPGGVFFGISPHPTSPWAWSDPGHTRVISPECLVFLQQLQYVQVGISPMTDYRFCYSGDFDLIYCNVADDKTFRFALRAVKPARQIPLLFSETEKVINE
jgi:hypothetical protein